MHICIAYATPRAVMRFAAQKHILRLHCDRPKHQPTDLAKFPPKSPLAHPTPLVTGSVADPGSAVAPLDEIPQTANPRLSSLPYTATVTAAPYTLTQQKGRTNLVRPSKS